MPTSTALKPRRTKPLVVRRARLDAELVRRGLARSRNQAADLVVAGRVRVAGQVANKVATAVGPDDALLVTDVGQPMVVSRGAHKLVGALEAFSGVTVKGRRCLDAGASTGGFTDVLLRNEAASVIAVDVGYGQLHERLRGCGYRGRLCRWRRECLHRNRRCNRGRVRSRRNAKTRLEDRSSIWRESSYPPLRSPA